MAGCRIRGVLRDSVGSLLGGVRVSKALELLPTHCQVKPDLGVIVRPLADRTSSWNLDAESWDRRPRFRSLLEGVPIPDTVEYGVQRVLEVALVC